MGFGKKVAPEPTKRVSMINQLRMINALLANRDPQTKQDPVPLLLRRMKLEALLPLTHPARKFGAKY